MRTFVSISSCGYLIAQSSIIGERQTEMYSSPNAPSRLFLPQRPDCTHSVSKSRIGLHSVHPHISAATRFRPPKPRPRFPTDLFQSRKYPTSVPKASKSLRSTISKHQKGHNQHQLFKSNGPEKRYQFPTPHFQPSIRHHPCKPPILYTSVRPITHHTHSHPSKTTQQCQHQHSNTVVPSPTKS